MITTSTSWKNVLCVLPTSTYRSNVVYFAAHIAHIGSIQYPGLRSRAPCVWMWTNQALPMVAPRCLLADLRRAACTAPPRPTPCRHWLVPWATSRYNPSSVWARLRSVGEYIRPLVPCPPLVIAPVQSSSNASLFRLPLISSDHPSTF